MLSIRTWVAAAMVCAVSCATSFAASPYPGAAPAGVTPASGTVASAPIAGYQGHQYPQLNAPLYPSPVQYTPAWNGGTIITNQAFAPHEMLYPHKYHAMYPPFYYKVKGSWFWTPFGMHQHEHWKLQGTEVKVNYRSHYKFLSGFHPPRVD